MLVSSPLFALLTRGISFSDIISFQNFTATSLCLRAVSLSRKERSIKYPKSVIHLESSFQGGRGASATEEVCSPPSGGCKPIIPNLRQFILLTKFFVHRKEEYYVVCKF